MGPGRNISILTTSVIICCSFWAPPAIAAPEIYKFPLGAQFLSIEVSHKEVIPGYTPVIVGDTIQVSVGIHLAPGAFLGEDLCMYEISSGYYFEGTVYQESRMAISEVSSGTMVFEIPHEGEYRIHVKGFSKCFVLENNLSGAKRIWKTFPINTLTPSFSAVRESKPPALKILKTTCTPGFKISRKTEFSYSCTTVVIDKAHTADSFSLSPAPGTPLNPYGSSIEVNSKKWIRNTSGWSITSKFKLLTVSPSDMTKLRSIEYLSVNTMVEDRLLDHNQGFNRLAVSGLQLNSFQFKKVKT